MDSHTCPTPIPHPDTASTTNYGGNQFFSSGNCSAYQLHAYTNFLRTGWLLEAA